MDNRENYVAKQKTERLMKIGLVLEGGAKCGIFTAGVLDYMKNRLDMFSYIGGVSAGAGAAMDFVAEQPGRTKKVITPDKENAYMGLDSLLRTGKFINLDYMAYDYTEKIFPFDFDTYFRNINQKGITVEYVCANCQTGKTDYLSESSDKDRLLKIIKASCSLPILCPPSECDGSYYLDGSITDAVPFERALECGCDKVIAVMTRPAGAHHTDYRKFSKVLKAMYGSKYPAVYECLMKRSSAYDKQEKRMKALVKEGKVLVVRPQKKFSISKFERSDKKLAELYRHGYKLMHNKEKALTEFLAK